MLDTCTVTRQTSAVTNPETGVITATFSTIYSGKCKFQQSPAPSGSTQNVGEASLVVSYQQLHLPASVTAVAVEDVVTCTASVLDAALPGLKFSVRAIADKTFLTARRLDILQVES